jgi:hypothetical protein
VIRERVVRIDEQERVAEELADVLREIEDDAAIRSAEEKTERLLRRRHTARGPGHRRKRAQSVDRILQRKNQRLADPDDAAFERQPIAQPPQRPGHVRLRRDAKQKRASDRRAVGKDGRLGVLDHRARIMAETYVFA